MTASSRVNPTPVPGSRPEPGEEFFRQSIADLSKRLGERAARESTSEPQSAAEARRRAMQAYDRERNRKIRLILTGAGAVVATAGLAWAVVLLGEPETLLPAASQIADVQSAAPSGPASTGPAAAGPAVVTSAMPPANDQSQRVEPPSKAAETPPQPTVVTESQPPSAPVQADPPSAPPAQTAATRPSDPPQAEPSKAQPPQPQPAPVAPPRASLLSRDEIREVQKRLRGFGFDPGPADGVAGRQTEVATQRYLEARGQPQLPPTDRDLLDQLRQDPAPTQVAQRPTQSEGAYSGYGTQPTAASQPQRRYSSDPFQPVKAAGAQITRFLEGVFRAPASNQQ